MAIKLINVGLKENDKSGDPIRTAFIKINDNFQEIIVIKDGLDTAINHVYDETRHLSTYQQAWLSNITVSSEVVNYLSGTTQNIQTQINNTQPLNGDLEAIAALPSTTGLLKKIAFNNWTIDTSNYITGNQLITVSGDVSGSGTTSIELLLSSTGVEPGTYNSVTVDAKGRVTNASVISYTSRLDELSDVNFTSTPQNGNKIIHNGTSWTIDTNSYLTGNEQITITGDVSGSGTTSIELLLSDTGVQTGTYNSVTVDAKGRITSASSVSYPDRLDELLDVNFTSTPQTGDVLVHNGTNWDTNLNVNFKNKLVDSAKLINYSETIKYETINNGVLSIDIALGNTIVVTLTQNITSIIINNSKNWVSDTLYAMSLIIIQNDSSPKNITWPNSFKWDSQLPMSISQTLGAIDYLNLVSYTNGSTWLCFPAGQNMG